MRNFTDYASWREAVQRLGGEVYASGAACGEYEARKDGVILGEFSKTNCNGWTI